MVGDNDEDKQMINFDFVIEDIEDNDTGKPKVSLGIEKVEKDAGGLGKKAK